MKPFKNWRTAALLFWVAAIIVAVIALPNLTKLGQEKGQITLPSNFESEKAATILNDMNNDGKSTYEFAIVFHDKDGISSADQKEMDRVLTYFEDHKEKYAITDTFFYNDSKQAENQLVSEDGTTIINQLTIEKDLKSATDVANELNKELDTISLKSYITGSDVVMDDFSQTSQEGVQKTEIIAVILIIVILIAIFRSPVIPFVSLLSVGVAYIVSLSIITKLVEQFNFPFSNFTQVFLVVILFGIGTDYNILLFTRFREELARKNNVLLAMKETYRTAGRTILYSGIAVLFGMVALFFAEFAFYRATGGVAIGVGVLLIVLFTLNPFFMGLLGMKLFWPIKTAKSHSDNKTWGFLAKHSFTKPILGLIIVAIVAIPSILMYSGKLNFNDLTEINDKYESKQAINLISEKFPAGMSSPTTLVIESENKLTDSETLQDIDRLTARLNEIKGVDQVFSVTRPEAKKVDALYLDNQMDTLTSNVQEMEKGTKDIRTGLESAKAQSAQSTAQAASQLPPAVAAQMAQQAEAQGKGVDQATDGLKKIENGLSETADYTSTLQKDQANTLNIPESVLTGKEFKQSLDQYMDGTEKRTTMTIILKENPYTAEAMDVMRDVQKTTHAFIDGSSTLHETDAYLGGKTMSNLDLEEMSSNDFQRSIIIILIGISIMLLFITRSLAQTMIILVSLIVASFASLGITEWITTTFLHADALSWNVPFFTYIMLITLGVDYSIFLMMRFKELGDDGLSMIVEACKKMGGVILSAAVILGCTFAALMPSGINTLIQVAIAVIIGLVLLALLLMPVFIPSVFGIANMANKKKDNK